MLRYKPLQKVHIVHTFRRSKMLLKGKKVLRHIATLLTMAMLIGTTAFASEGETKVYVI